MWHGFSVLLVCIKRVFPYIQTSLKSLKVINSRELFSEIQPNCLSLGANCLTVLLTHAYQCCYMLTADLRRIMKLYKLKLNLCCSRLWHNVCRSEFSFGNFRAVFKVQNLKRCNGPEMFCKKTNIFAALDHVVFWLLIELFLQKT